MVDTWLLSDVSNRIISRLGLPTRSSRTPQKISEICAARTRYSDGVEIERTSHRLPQKGQNRSNFSHHHLASSYLSMQNSYLTAELPCSPPPTIPSEGVHRTNPWQQRVRLFESIDSANLTLRRYVRLLCPTVLNKISYRFDKGMLHIESKKWELSHRRRNFKRRHNTADVVLWPAIESFMLNSIHCYILKLLFLHLFLLTAVLSRRACQARTTPKRVRS